MQQTMISIGNFFFKYRNKAFPLITVMLFAIAVPPHDLFGSPGLENAKDVIALLIAGLGLVVRGSVIGFAYIKRGGVDKKVYAENLVTSGIFGICRNPLYVGNILICIGIFLMHGNPGVMIAGIGFYLFIYQCIVLAEETYLRNKFGAGYAAYARDVPRWLPQFANLKTATAGMTFNYKKVLFKDYGTIATTLIMLILTEGYEYLALPDVDLHLNYLLLLGGMVLMCLLAMAAVKYVKKRLPAPV